MKGFSLLSKCKVPSVNLSLLLDKSKLNFSKEVSEHLSA